MGSSPDATSLPPLELLADGALRVGGRAWARLDGCRVVAMDGAELLRVDPDGRLMAHDRAVGTLTPGGDVDTPRGSVHLEDDGTPVILRHPDGRREPGPLRVVGFVPAARSTAAVLVVLILLAGHAPAANAPVP